MRWSRPQATKATISVLRLSIGIWLAVVAKMSIASYLVEAKEEGGGA